MHYLTAYDVVRGLRAVNVLLKGARKDPAVKSQGREINFIKKGDLQQAIMDFHSVLPVHVKTYRQPNEVGLEIEYSLYTIDMTFIHGVKS